jgi:cell fate regulator YaaT (PSP1 superfamily)
LCCTTFIGEFEPVSIRMAKNQNISLNPQKISGVCGKLLCCIKYEDDAYTRLKKTLPDLKDNVMTKDGKGTVVQLNIIGQKVRVRFQDDGRYEWVEAEDVSRQEDDA